MFRDHYIDHNHEYRTPLYYYDLNLLEATLESLSSAAHHFGYHVHYALKANYNKPILEKVSSFGLGADCVSGNEIQRALETGFYAESIAFAGVGKTDEEINYALDKKIFGFNCESTQELEVINELAGRKNMIAPVFLRINPNVDADTHHLITTGTSENKFGMMESEALDILLSNGQYPNIEFMGLHFHIGSQITGQGPFLALCQKINRIQQLLAESGIRLKHLNVGGGLGIDYQEPLVNPIPDFYSFFELFHQNLALGPDQQLHFELGRSVVAQCGTLLSRVLYVKEGANRTFAIIDASMTDLIRPALYHAYHKIENLSSINSNGKLYNVVGPVCESSDTFGEDVPLGETARGDLIAIRSVGAYGQVMSSSYNLRNPAETIYSDGAFELSQPDMKSEKTGILK